MPDVRDAKEFWETWKEVQKDRRERNLAKANPTGWTQHNPYHWSRELNGHRLDYWPIRNKFRYKNKVMCGDVLGFIRKREIK